MTKRIIIAPARADSPKRLHDLVVAEIFAVFQLLEHPLGRVDQQARVGISKETTHRRISYVVGLDHTTLDNRHRVISLAGRLLESRTFALGKNRA